MRIKKGFTLAEILIVLMVIGVIATMTVPSLMKGVNEAQFKTAYKKAFNAVTNIAAVEKISGQLPTKASETGAKNFFASLNGNLSVKEFYDAPAGGATGAGTTQSQEPQDDSKTYTKTNFLGTDYGSASSGAVSYTGATSMTAGTTYSPWIVTEDGLAYSITTGNATGDCGTKTVITEQSTLTSALAQTCIVVMVDVNGLAKGPNKLETQVYSDLSSGVKMNTLEGDRYYIFVGSDGVSAGNKATTLSGRLMADMK